MDTNGVSHTGDTTLLRKVNESAVMEIIQDHGPVTRAEVARRLNLSLATITRIVSTLTENNLVHERRSADSRGGRRPTLLELNYRANLIIGVHVENCMVGALADLNGTILHRLAWPSAAGEAGVAQLIELIRQLRGQAEKLELPVRGVGVGVESIVRQPDGVVAWAPVLAWRDVPLRARLEQALGLPVIVQNGINLIALGESWRGAGRGIENLACIFVGDGIGAGLVINGQVYNGSHHAAGEIGYLLPNQHFLGRTYDTFGYLESEAGGHGIVRRAEQLLAAGQPSVLASATNGGSSPSLTARAVLEAARAGDLLARTVVDETVGYLAVALANLACIVDPQRIILTGELAEYADLLVEPIRARIADSIPALPEIVASELRIDAAVLGAVALVVRETSDALFVRPSRA